MNNNCNTKAMNNTYLIQISTEPIDPNDLEENDWKLDKFFFEHNPWGLQGISDIVDRKDTLDELKSEFSNGFFIDSDNETIELPNNDNYLLEVIEELHNASIDQVKHCFGSAHYWWTREVCHFGDILIYFENGELFTLPSFLFYARENHYRKLYIGTVYWYDC